MATETTHQRPDSRAAKRSALVRELTQPRNVENLRLGIRRHIENTGDVHFLEENLVLEGAEVDLLTVTDRDATIYFLDRTSEEIQAAIDAYACAFPGVYRTTAIHINGRVEEIPLPEGYAGTIH